MKPIMNRTLLASALVLALAGPGWAAGSANTDAANQAYAQKRAWKSDRVKEIQRALKAKGEDPGPIDGHMGKKTREAIQAFQKSNDLKVTGRVDRKTAEKLGVKLAATSKTPMAKNEKKSKMK
jgi:peptidoglycan hydrolase-like protein with peptidoglycan-binding domain